MATVNFRLRSKEKNKEVSIYVYISLDRNNVYQCPSSYKIDPKFWRTKKGMPDPSNKDFNQLGDDLNDLRKFILKQVDVDLYRGVEFDIIWLKTQVKRFRDMPDEGEVDHRVLKNHVKYILENANTRRIKANGKVGLSKNSIKGYATFLGIVERYEKHLAHPIHFLDIDKVFTDKFINWLMNKENYGVNTSGKQIDVLKAVINDAESFGVQVNPFVKQMKGFSESKEEKHFETLSFEELEKIKNTPLRNSLDNARKWLLIGCSIGQRGSDLLKITDENLRYNNGNLYVDVMQQKSKKEVTIGIFDPYIKHLLENEMPYKISSQKFNRYLKELCQIAGLNELRKGKKNQKFEKGTLNLEKDTFRKVLGFYPKYELIGSHICRRSFATNYYKKMPTPVLMEITGHSKESTFLAYINKPKDKDENANLFMRFAKEINDNRDNNLKAI